jgi:TonB family protein
MKPERRTWQFWLWGFVFLFLAHALALLRFGEREAPIVTWEQPRPFFYYSLDKESDRQIAEHTLGRDPTLFALPNPHGFSGGAWLSFQPEAPKLTNGSAPPEWLALSMEQLGQSLDDYVATNSPSEKQLLASVRAARNIEIRTPDQPFLTRTLVKIEGPLASRKLVRVPALPSAMHSDVLPRTVITVSVRGDGVVEAASVSGESGLKAADEQAVEAARDFEFEPMPIRDALARAVAAPTIGRLVFTWHAVTNSPSVTASTR